MRKRDQLFLRFGTRSDLILETAHHFTCRGTTSLTRLNCARVVGVALFAGNTAHRLADVAVSRVRIEPCLGPSPQSVGKILLLDRGGSGGGLA